ncbi:uncharacterized protein K441DRAFT_98299 [Cenococcum geophilum 1.58]|uniref:uncharacterized protein n=1 Tax=Cenococcum geophilum 1.58 TaxID=794803 RepID=UPI00358F0DDD|nr:hypothetical protein K441DRAFT_98299 [Cenococcum geophilum 1.58]
MLSARLEEIHSQVNRTNCTVTLHPLPTGPLSSWKMDPSVFNNHLAPTERIPWKEDEHEVEEGEEEEEEEEGKTVCWLPNKFLPIRFVCHLRPPQKHSGLESAQLTLKPFESQRKILTTICVAMQNERMHQLNCHVQKKSVVLRIFLFIHNE